MEQRVTLITLGVRDLARVRAFYESLGWNTASAPEDDVVFFQAGGMIVGLWHRARLAEDTGVVDGGGWGSVTLAHNVALPRDAERVIEQARAAGGNIVREPGETFWGANSGVFADPDGHPGGSSPQPALEHQKRRIYPPS